MKRTVFIVLSSLLLVFWINGQSVYPTDEVKLFRESRDKDFRNPNLSPLRADYFSSFDRLKYFPIDESYSVKAVFTESTGEKSFILPTSSGRSAKYLKIGVLTFSLNGKEFSLNAYRRDYANTNFKPIDNALFVPFKDLTNGKETYGAGRYIYVRMPNEKAAILDFNLAYNPSCAYGDANFSCPIPPKENFLKVEIKAGEMIYK